MTRCYLIALLVGMSLLPAVPATVVIDTPMPAPAWARLERQILATSVPGVPGVLREVLRRARLSPGLRALGRERRSRRCVRELQPLAGAACARGDDEILRLHLKAGEGMIRQYTEARTTDVPTGREWHVLQGFLRAVRLDAPRRSPADLQPLALSAPDLPAYRNRARRFAALYMGEDPDAPNYDPDKKLIRSMINGSRGPMLRKATALDWVGDPFDPTVRRAARREQLRAVPRALSGIHRRRRRSLPESRRHHPAAQRVSPDQRGEVQTAGSSTTWTRGWRG